MPLTQARWLFSRATGVQGTRTSRMTTYRTEMLILVEANSGGKHTLIQDTTRHLDYNYNICGKVSVKDSNFRLLWLNNRDVATDLHAVHGHCGQVVGVLLVPAEAEQRVVLGVFIDDGAVLQVPEVKHADGSVGSH